jgi:hypothetical protein
VMYVAQPWSNCCAATRSGSASSGTTSSNPMHFFMWLSCA